MRRAERRAYFQARRRGEHYCHACGTYRVPSDFTASGGRACDRLLASAVEQKPMAAFVRFRDAKRTVAVTVEPQAAVDEQARARILDRPHRREPSARGVATQVLGGAQPQRYGRPPRRRRIWPRAFRTRPRRTR